MSCAFELIPRVCDTATLTCIDLPTSGPCRTSGAPCDYFRAFCDTSVTPATCRPTKGVGEVCTSSKECAGELHERTCGAADAQGVQRCEARAPATCP